MSHQLNTSFTKSVDESEWKSRSIHMPRHRWYSYKEGFSPKVVERAIDEACLKPDDIVIDPFNGGGTTTLCCALKGVNAVGIEVNPFSRFVSQSKQSSLLLNEFNRCASIIYQGIEKGGESNLLHFSTFSEYGQHQGKWLFNSSVLNAFEGGRRASETLSEPYKEVFKLALVGAALDSANAAKDGKCLKYKKNWAVQKFDKYSFQYNFTRRVKTITDDIVLIPEILSPSVLIEGDCRSILKAASLPEYKLCITSPPYLNSFDYTDIYRPELFLSGLITTQDQLRNLRTQTLRSHVETKLKMPTRSDFGFLYQEISKQIRERDDLLWDRQIPFMIQAYFEDIESILISLKNKAKEGAKIWFVVSNSAYAGVEIPVDLIIADIGTKIGLYLQEIGVLRYVNKRKTKYSNNIESLRESIVIFNTKK